MRHATDCGDPGCDTCHPPRQRCQTCGALHADPAVPYCSPACAAAEVGPDAGGRGGPLTANHGQG